MSLIGEFETKDYPSKELLASLKNFLIGAVRSGKLREDYVIYSHSCVRPTKSPGKRVIAEIEILPHYHNSSNPDEKHCVS